jgi:hypothetical protein
MLRCMLEELLGGGLSTAEIRGMAGDPNYQALYAARAVLGETLFARMLDETAARVGIRRARVQERRATEFPAVLTISSGARGAEGRGAR